MSAEVIQGDAVGVMGAMEPGTVDSVVTDPPYGLEFMGKEWDAPWKNGFAEFGLEDSKNRRAAPVFGSKRNPCCRKCRKHQRGTDRCQCDTPDMDETRAEWARAFGDWSEEWSTATLRVLRPGGYMLAMGGTRTYHRLACAVEDAGFEIRDCLMWVYGSGFPKGRGCLKPAYEPILLCRKPGAKVLPLGIEECRVGTEDRREYPNGPGGKSHHYRSDKRSEEVRPNPWSMPTAGRWPANLAHDGSDEVMEAFAAFPVHRAGHARDGTGAQVADSYDASSYHMPSNRKMHRFGDTGTAARFFYTAKASKRERGPGNTHPTVKPLALMRWLCKLVTPPGGLILDPFGGSGTTGLAAQECGFRAVLIERDPAYVAIARRRLAECEPAMMRA